MGILSIIRDRIFADKVKVKHQGKGRHMEQDKAVHWIRNLCAYAGESEDFAEAFYEKLKQNKEVYEEFVYFMENGNFACRANVKGYTVVDVMVWQMDHFKARLDQDNSKTRQNGDRMVLLAFNTFLNLVKEPDQYIRKMQAETGTDYPEKY